MTFTTNQITADNNVQLINTEANTSPVRFIDDGSFSVAIGYKLKGNFNINR